MLQTVGLGKMKPNTVIFGFKREWKKLWKDPSEREAIKEYVNVVHDAFELNYGVAILRLRGELDLQELAKFEEEDWLAEEDEIAVNSVPPEIQVSAEASDDQGVVSSEVQSESSGRIFHVEKRTSPSGEEFVLDAVKENDNLVSEKDTGKDEAEEGKEENPSVVKTGKFKVTVSKEPVEDDAEDQFGETVKLTEPVVETQDAPTEAEVAFKDKPKGTIDVWWLFDDGGLTILIPYLLSIHNYWKDCKLRIFTPASSHALKSNELRMANLLKRFRIDFSSVVEVEGINNPPSSASVQNFMKLPVREDFADIKELEKDRKTMHNIRLGELIREHSNDAKLIVLTLPVPKVEMTSPLLYMSWLEVLSAASPPVLMVRGNQQSVLTFYS